MSFAYEFAWRILCQRKFTIKTQSNWHSFKFLVFLCNLFFYFFIYIKPILNGTGLQVHDLLPYERPKCPYYTCIRFGIPGIKSRTSLTTKSVLWETIVPFKKALRPPSWLGPCPSTNPRKDQGNPTQPIKEGGSKTKEKRKE